jgi:hypothetical protein
MAHLELTDDVKTRLAARHEDVDVWLAHMQGLVDNGRWGEAEFYRAVTEQLVAADKIIGDMGDDYTTWAVRKAAEEEAEAARFGS